MMGQMFGKWSKIGLADPSGLAFYDRTSLLEMFALFASFHRLDWLCTHTTVWQLWHHGLRCSALALASATAAFWVGLASAWYYAGIPLPALLCGGYGLLQGPDAVADLLAWHVFLDPEAPADVWSNTLSYADPYGADDGPLWSFNDRLHIEHHVKPGESQRTLCAGVFFPHSALGTQPLELHWADLPLLLNQHVHEGRYYSLSQPDGRGIELGKELR